MKHEKEYRGLPNGAGQIVCACGWESPAVDDSTAFTLGRRTKSVEQYFAEHLENVRPQSGVETAMIAPARETAVTPAQRPQPKKFKEAMARFRNKEKQS